MRGREAEGVDRVASRGGSIDARDHRDRLRSGSCGFASSEGLETGGGEESIEESSEDE